VDISIEKTALDGVFVVNHQAFQDDRGFFTEVYRKDLFGEQGLPESFVQLNHSGSVRNVLRGLHFQWEPPMGKMMRVTRGVAFLVAVDIRKDSPTLGEWFGIELSAEDRRQVWAPAGFARGFCVLSDYAEIMYLCTGTYNSQCESGILWEDPEIGIKWPVDEPIISGKDHNAQTLSAWLSRKESTFFTNEKE
jgi:dTDP-4-dehydrorhamnose 3,5-epimerase|tara:strand:- start:4957 stop:5532 length:576 start_codon:yes stop_codon:yes gene_type:complete